MTKLDFCEKLNLLSHYGFSRVLKSSVDALYVSSGLSESDFVLLEKLGLLIYRFKGDEVYAYFRFDHD